MHLSFRLINVSIGNMGTPLSPFSAVLVSITCHSTGSSSVPHSRVCWHSQGKASLGLLTTPTSVKQGAHGAAHAPPRHELLRKEEKPAHTPPAASSVLDRAGKVSSSTFWSPAPGVPKLLCATTAPALTPTRTGPAQSPAKH